MTYQQFLDQVDSATEQWFLKQNSSKDSKHRYMLADKSHWSENTISPGVAQYIKNNSIKLHRYAHNGRSSQMMLFNLIIPLINSGDLYTLIGLLNPNLQSSEQSIQGQFEYVKPSVLQEIGGTPTSVDLMIEQDNQIQFVIEAKFTELAIGQCSKFNSKVCAGDSPDQDFNLCPLHKDANRLYWTLLERHSFLNAGFQIQGQCVLARYYQFFRMFLFALETDSQFVLLYDERNTKIAPEIPDMMKLVPEKHHHRFQEITIQQIALAIEQSGKHSWIRDFKAKYAL